jgi:Flp pilus assembly pilin Flp
MGDGLWKWIRDEDGTAVVEYALLLVVVVLISAAAWTALKNEVTTALGAATNSISQPYG